MAQYALIFVNSIFLIYFGLFLFSSIVEKEKRAALVSLAILLFLSLTLLFVSFTAISNSLYWGINLVVLSMLALLFLPYGGVSTIKTAGEQTRYDERDIMFARARYAAGSDAYRDYYSRHPQRKKTDDALRAMPNLLSPGGRHYEAVAAKMADVNFTLTEKLIPFCQGTPASEKTSVPATEATAVVKRLIRSLGAVDVGVARLDPIHLYSHVGRGPGGYGTPIAKEFENVIVFAVEMDFNAMRHAPKMPVVVESSKQYLEAAKIAITAASFIRSLGYNARAHTDANYRFMLPAAAVDAGLGEVGRIGYLIHPKYGARVRLGAVTTDIPLDFDSPVAFGVQDFCRLCKKCATHCPAGAISHGAEKPVRGVWKWSTNQEACYRYWRTVGTDCGICMRVCPYSKPANLAHDVVRFVIRQNPVARRLALWGDKVLYPYNER